MRLKTPYKKPFQTPFYSKIFKNFRKKSDIFWRSRGVLSRELSLKMIFPCLLDLEKSSEFNLYMHLVDGDFIMEVRSTCIQFWKTSPERFLCIHSTNHSRTRWLGSGATCYEMTGFWGSFFWILPTCRISSRYLYFASFLVEGRCSIVFKLYDLSSMMGR